ncbi:hypothetical protein XENTR_v10008686 [Xenopus tropicalis]|nr:hypothetical protein XENTR_v10008686 [Xenopus tropicalis]KAE8615998.1 hypothetical protein XENTR_v10008686 [Xenopus tropicalis]KAE8615999.1 hypothetical protein XENTR_v10008686 [Xenopus tropicalis]
MRTIGSKQMMIWLVITVLYIITAMNTAQQLKQARIPFIQNKPFLAVWNAPTEQCKQRYKVDLDLSIFDIVANPNETLIGSNVTIFYHTHLGHYPYFTDEGEPVNGGVPQNESLKKHLNKSEHDINRLIPNLDFKGLGVVDWENWRPQWDRNWGSKLIYRNKSIELVKNHHPTWSDEQLKKKAKEEFDNAAKEFMTKTIALAQEKRSKGLWGYYLFPDCYNYDYKENPQSYTGRCPDIEMTRNDLLKWLWKESNALYPSIYLDYVLKSSPNVLKFVHHRVKESMRVASMARKDYSLPVFVYSRPFYSYTLYTLSEADLIYTIGESAALGAAGIVLWGGMQYASTKESCITVKKYIDGPLGHYLVNVTAAAKMCSKVLCKKNGRCLRNNIDSPDYLHLNPNHFKIKKHFSGKGFFATGKPGWEDIHYMEQRFMCQCYEGWTGVFCELPEQVGRKEKISPNSLGRSVLPLCIIYYVLLYTILSETLNV